MSARFITALVVLLAAARSAPAVTIETVPVGYLNNASDQDYFNGPQGTVSYNYRIGTYEVTNSQYAEFLNAKAASDPLGLYNPDMATDPRAGIVRSGVDGSYAYALKPNMGNKPVMHVSWYDAIRFTNWLHNDQGSGDTETGAYTIEGGTQTPTNGSTITRNPGAIWFLPDRAEWYKAAYYDPRPEAQGGPIGDDNYWFFPTSSDAIPERIHADSVGDVSNPGPNIANYFDGADWNGLNGNVTTVGGAGPLSESFFGTSDQGGNIGEWTEELFNGGADRGAMGGYWGFDSVLLQADLHNVNSGLFGGPTTEADFVGFRVAMVPEPSTLTLTSLSVLGVLAWCWRCRKVLQP